MKSRNNNNILSTSEGYVFVIFLFCSLLKLYCTKKANTSGRSSGVCDSGQKFTNWFQVISQDETIPGRGKLLEIFGEVLLSRMEF